MSQSLKALMNVSGAISWPIGGLKAATEIMLPANSTDTPSQAVVMDYKGMKILYRGAQFTLLQSEYPECFTQIGNGFGITVFVTRTITGQTDVKSLDSNVSTLIAVGDGGKISRASDGGVTWAAVTSPVATNLKVIKYVPALNKWIIPYTTNKCLISTDATGTTFTDTTVTGLSVDLSSLTNTDIRFYFIGNVMVLCTKDNTYTSTNGTAWTEVLVGVGTHRRLTIGNGYFVVVYSPDGTALNFKYSTNGTTWSNGASSLLTNSVDSITEGWGLVYDGTRWTWFRGNYTESGYTSTYPSTGAMPPANTYYNPGGSTSFLQYTTTGNPGSSMGYVNFTVAGSDFTNWQNWKPGVGTTTYWYKGSFDFYYCSGPSLHGFNQISYSSSIVAVQQKGYGESNGSNYSLYRMTNTIISNMITNGNTWSTSGISPGTLWSTIEPAYGNWTTTSPNYTWGITYDSYYFKVASNTTIQISGSITNPSVDVPVVSNGYMRLA